LTDSSLGSKSINTLTCIAEEVDNFTQHADKGSATIGISSLDNISVSLSPEN